MIYNKYQLCETKEKINEIFKKIVIENNKVNKRLVFIEGNFCYI